MNGGTKAVHWSKWAPRSPSVEVTLKYPCVRQELIELAPQMEWRRTTEILLGGSTILLPSETNPGKTGILKYKNWQKRPDGVQTLHSIEAAKTLGNKIFSLSVAYMQELELEVPKFLPNVREDVTPRTQQGWIQTAQMGQIHTQPRLQA